MKMMCRTLGVARSSYYASNKQSKGDCIPGRNNEFDPDLVLRIWRLVKRYATYGYRRITALLRRDKQASKVNHKAVYRIMKAFRWLYRKPKPRPTRTHYGKVSVPKSNMRWCSDVFRIQCDNGEHVEVLFALDCHDREVISWTYTTGGINSECVQNLVVDCVSARFNDHLTHRIQWLTDNGPCYVSKSTVGFLRSMGFEVCTTRPYSPESNGMAEAFVKTFKRDYAELGDRSSADAVTRKLGQWFEEYNSHAPHKALGMMSPRDYRELKQAG